MSIIATDNYVLDIVFPDAQKDYKVQYQGELATVVNTLLDKQTKLNSFKHLLDKMSIAIASSTSVVIGADAYLIEVLSENEVYKELTNIMQKNIKRLVDIKFVTEEKWKPLVNKMIQLTKEKEYMHKNKTATLSSLIFNLFSTLFNSRLILRSSLFTCFSVNALFNSSRSLFSSFISCDVMNFSKFILITPPSCK